MPPDTPGQRTTPVLVTGATGVVGGALLRLLLAEGGRVRALARSPAAARALAAQGAEPAIGSLEDPASLERAVEGCHLVFHVAGHNAYCLRDPEALFRVNVAGSLNLYRACQAAGVARFVHTSSAVTFGEAKGTVGGEGQPHRGHFLTAYERSKHEAELVLRSEAVGTELVMVNPASVQGPGRAEGTGALLLALARGRLPLALDSRLSIVDIRDCAEGLLAAARHGEAGGRYLLSGFDLPLAEVAEQLRSLAGRPGRSPWLLDPRWLEGPVRWLWSVAPGRLRLCPETLANLKHGARYDGAGAAQALGLQYRPAQETLADLVVWFKATGRL